jgi:hypothetical protein
MNNLALFRLYREPGCRRGGELMTQLQDIACQANNLAFAG